MTEFARIWNRLASLARADRARGDVEVEAPAGFSTRVVAVWLASRSRAAASAWEWLAVRGLGLACLVAVLSVAVVWPALSNSSHDELAELADPLSAEEIVQ